MKRLSASEIKKRNSFFLVSAIVIFALSVTAIASLLTNYIDPPYEKLPETATTVEKTVYEHGVIVPFFGHLGEKTYLTASDGNAYAIPKSLHTSGALSEGEEVVIKYRKTWVGSLFGVIYAREIRSGDGVVMPYSPPNSRDVIIVCVICSVGILLSFLLFLLYRWLVRMGLEREEKRDKRIIKKYGQLNK